MSYRFKPHRGLGMEVERVVAAQLARIRRLLDISVSSNPDSVSEARKVVKRTRSLLKLVSTIDKQACKRADTLLQNLQADLAAPRDDLAVCEAAQSLALRFTDQNHEQDALFLEDIAHRLEQRRLQHLRGQKLLAVELAVHVIKLDEVRNCLSEMDKDIPISHEAKILHHGIAKNLGKAKAAFDIALESETAEDWHEFRKHVKHHRMHMRLLKSAWPGGFRLRADVARLIQIDLGEDHDLWILQQIAEKEPGIVEWPDGIARLTSLIERRNRHLRRNARFGARYLFCDDPDLVAGVVARLWKLARRADN